MNLAIKINVRVAFGFALLLAVQPPVTEAAEITSIVVTKSTAISNQAIKNTARKFGQDAANRVIAWNDLIRKNKDKPIAEKLELANRFINSIPFKAEEELWGHSHWSTPYEMITRNAGSHADHAIAKYVTLEALGIETGTVYLVHAHSAATPSNSYIVLAYYASPDDKIPLVLDSVIGEIKPASERKDLVTEHSLNNDGAWLARVQADGAKDADLEAFVHTELWDEMKNRMDKEMLSVEYPSAR